MQATLEKAISSVTQDVSRVVGSGRTDAGAHALHQVIAFDTNSALAPETLLRAINKHLPFDVAVTSVAEANGDFHPRFDAVSRTYRYLIWNREIRSPFWTERAAHVRRLLDTGAMARAGQELVGVHDFSAFTGTPQVEGRTRRLDRAECRREGDLVVIELEASGFMRQMVRAIAGTLILAGEGKLGASDVRAILVSRDRARAGGTAPACGLYLIDVRYPAGSGEIVPEEKK